MSGPLFITPDDKALERFYAEVKSGDWLCPNGCLGGYMDMARGPGCTVCGWGWNADASRVSHAPYGVPCKWDGLPALAEPHCGWRLATADDSIVHDHHDHSDSPEKTT